MADGREGRRPGGSEDLGESVRRRADRRLRARNKGRRAVWFGFGLFGLIGWSVAIPTLIGVAVGLWLDSLWPNGVSWTLTFIVIGVAVGCLNAWYWVKQESRRE